MVEGGVWKPTANGEAKLLADSCEVKNLKLVAGGGAAFVSIYDAKDAGGANESNLKWVLDASTSDVDSESFEGLIFRKGVYAVLEQGGNFSPVICIGIKAYKA